MRFSRLMKMMAVLGLASLVAPWTLMSQQRRRSQTGNANPLAGSPQAIEAGRTQFRQICAPCHGAEAEGGQGEGQVPSLVTNNTVRRASDKQVFGFIRNGVPGTAMPSIALPEAKIWQLVAYVRSLSATAISLRVPGNVATGRGIFFGKGECASCHMIRGQGGFLGPDLSDIGASRRLDLLPLPAASASGPTAWTSATRGAATDDC